MPPGTRKNPCHGTDFHHYSVAYGVMSVRLHTLHNQAQTSNKAHDKFVPRRDCACADHSRPSLSTALLGGWSSHLVNRVSPHNPLVPSTLAWARRAYPSQARLGYAGADRSASHLALIQHHLIYIQIMVETALCKQFFMASLLNDAAVL